MATRIGQDITLEDFLGNPENLATGYQQPTQETSGIAPAIKRSIGGGFSSLGRFAQEVGLPSQGLTNYGEELQKEAGASPVQGLSDIIEHPGAFVSEGLGAGIGSMVPTGLASVAGNVVGGIAGGYLGGPVGVEVGRRLGGTLARAAVNIPSYIGSNLQRQDETGEHDLGKAVLGALGQAGTEELEAQVIGGLLPAGLSKKLGIDAVSKVMGEGGFSGDIVTRAVKGALTASAANAAEEYAQQQIERAQAGLDVGSSEAIQEGAFNAALGAIAGGALGTGAGAINAKPTTNIPGSSQKFSNKEIEKNYKRLDELLAQRVEAEKTGQDTAGFDKNIDDILSHLDSSFVNPTLEDGKKPSVKPMEKQEAEAVVGFVNKIREAQKPSQEEIEITDLTPLQKMSESQMAIALDNAKRRLSEINAKARGEDATEVINPETGKKVKLPGKFANYLNSAEQEERSILKNIISSGNREALVNWHERMYKPRIAQQVSTEGIQVSDQLPAPIEEINIPDVSGQRYADQLSPVPEEIDYSTIPEPVIPEEITAKAVNPVRQAIIDKEGRQAAAPTPTEEIEALPYEEREDVRAAQAKTYKAKAPATRTLNKLGIQETHEITEVAPKQFQITRKQNAQAVRSDEGQIQEAGTVGQGSQDEGSQNLQQQESQQPSNTEGEVENRGIRFFKEQAGPSIKNATPEETAGLFRNQAFDMVPGMEVSEITDPEMVREIMQKAFSGQKQTIDLSKVSTPAQSGMISRTLQKIEAAVNKVADAVRDAGIRIEYAETTAQIPDARVREIAQKESAAGMAIRGLFDDKANVIYIIGNGSRSPQEAVGTLYHELVGHYGMRKILGQKFENYMERLLKSPQLTQKIYNLGNRWKTYVINNPATKHDSFTWPGIKDANGKPVVTSRTAAIKLADEYVAELARLYSDPSAVDRYGLRTKGNKSFLDKVIGFIKHILKSIGFGSAIEGMTNEQIMQDLLKSYKSIFTDEANKYQADNFKSLMSNPAQQFSLNEPVLAFDVAPIEDSLFNLEEQGFGKTNFDEKTSSWNRFSTWLAHKPIAKNFVHLGTLQYQNQLLRLYNKARGKTTEIEKITRQIREKFEPLNKVQKMKLYEMLTEQNYDRSRLVGILPDDVVTLAQQAKDKISEYGDMLVKLGKLDPITYEQNKDKYLRTRYAKYLGESKGVGKIGSYQNYLKKKKDLSESDKTGLLEIKDPEFLLIDTLGTVGRDTALLGLLHNINYLSEKEKLGWVIDNPALFSADGTQMTLEEAKEHLTHQRSVIKDMGGILGYDDIRVQELVKEADKLEGKIADSYKKLDEQIAEFSQQQGMPSSMSPREFKDTYYTKLPTGKQYGKLSGLYVRKEIYDDLREGIDAFYNMNTQGKILKTMEAGHRLWKTAKVSWNLPTWFQNAFGNFGLLDLASPTNMGSLAQMTIQEIRDASKGKESKFWTLGQENGVFGTTLAAQELYTNEADFALKLKKLGDKNTGHKFADTWDQMKDLFLMFNEKTSNWYGLLEGAFKVVAIRDHIQRWEKETGRKFDNLTGNEREAVVGSAVRFANDAIFDYSAVPNWVKQIRRFPLGSPFLTFSYKALPAIIKALRYNPKKFIKYAVMPTLMMQMFLMANPDLDEEDYEEILAKQPQYMKDKSSMYLLPWKSADGKWEFWDAGYLLPWAPFINWGLYVKNHFNAMNYETTAESTVDAGYELLANTFGFLGGPAPQLISVWKTGVDPFTKEAIFEEGQPASEKWWKGMTYFSNMMMPSWLSGQGFAGKLQDALGVDVGPFSAETLNRYGTPKVTVGEAFAGLAGMKVKGVNPQESHLSNLKMFEVEEQKIKKAKTSELKNPNLKPSERLEVIKKYNALLINQRRKRSEYLRSIKPQE